jgi:hypothetical protein
MFFLSILLLIGFFVMYSQQSTQTSQRIYTGIRIERGQLSKLDIATITQQAYTDQHFTIYGDRRSRRIYISKTGRLYIYQIIKNHKTVTYITRTVALSILKSDIHRAKPTRVESRTSYTIQTLQPSTLSI